MQCDFNSSEMKLDKPVYIIVVKTIPMLFWKYCYATNQTLLYKIPWHEKLVKEYKYSYKF